MKRIIIALAVLTVFLVLYLPIVFPSPTTDPTPSPTTDPTPSNITLDYSNATDSGEGPTLYLFWGDGCPHCHDEREFLEGLKSKYPSLRIEAYETWNNASNSELFSDMAETYGFQARGVPTTFIGEDYWVGFSEGIGAELELKVRQCAENGICEDALFPGEDTVPEQTGDSGMPGLCIHAFLKEDCSQCSRITPFLESVSDQNDVSLTVHDVNQPDEEDLFNRFKDTYGVDSTGYPVVFVGNEVLPGETAIRENLENSISSCLQKEMCICPAERIRASFPSVPGQGDITPEDSIVLELPIFGRVDVSSMSIYASTALISFVDGFNPCSLWLIFFLMGIVIYTGSRKKMFLIGMTFLLVTGTAYGVFLVGALNVFSYVGQLFWIQLIVGMIAIAFAVINIKDYFWYKKGVSLTISDEKKPGLIKRMRTIMHPGKGLLGMMAATALLALGVVLVELPCTAGFPMIWANLVAQSGIEGGEYGVLTLLYMFIYLSIEIMIFLTIIFTMKVSKFQEKQGRMLKLLGGIIMMMLGLFMIFAPTLMESLQGSLFLFVLSAWLFCLILFLHRVVLPKCGIKIGTGKLANNEASDKTAKAGGNKDETTES